MRAIGFIVILILMFMTWVSHRNANYCALNSHEHIYSTVFIIAALTIFILIL